MLPSTEIAKTVTVKHLILPGYEAAHLPAVVQRETITEFLERSGWVFKSPTICVLNGQPVMRKDWCTTLILDNDEVVFLTRPWGGGGGGGGRGNKTSQIIGLVALIAIAAFAIWAAPLITGLAATAFATQLVQGAIILGGSLLVSAVFFPKPGGQSQDNSTNPIYSLAASGNTSKPLQPIPVTYGKLKWFPDYAATPWAEYIGNDQYLNLLLAMGMGEYHIHKIYVDDTVLWDESTGLQAPFTDTAFEQYAPDASVTLFPSNVYSSPDVSGQELQFDATIIGPFTSNTAGTTCSAIAIDYALPNGLYFVRSEDGSFGTQGVNITCYITPCDDSGTPTGPQVLAFNDYHEAATNQPLRFSHKFDVTPGRYLVECVHNLRDGPRSDLVDTVLWLGLRAFIDGPTSYANVTTLAIRVKANEQLSSSSTRKFGVLATRILPVWDGSTMTPTPTQNPLWAFYDAATNDVYGAGRDPSKIDFQSIVTHAQGADTRGDKFNYTFATTHPVPDAFDIILAPVRCKHRWAGDVLTVVRDEVVPVPQMLLTDRQIVRGSMSLSYVFNDDTQSDAVIVEYLDETTWAAGEVQYPANSGSFTATNPTRIQLPGITSRDQAYREAGFWYLQSYYRRVNVTLSTEHDGRLLGVGSTVRVQSDLPQSWGSTGIVLTQLSNTVTVSPAPDWTPSGQPYVSFRSKTGKPFGPIKCHKGGSNESIVLDSTDLATVESQMGITLTEALDRMAAAEEPSYDFGIGSAVSKTCIVLSGKPSGDQVQLSLVVDDPAVHTTDLSDTPVGPAVPPLGTPRSPRIAGLIGNITQGTSEPILSASWFAANGAISYTADVSYDGGTTWFHVYDGTAQNFSVVVARNDLRLRVAAIGIQHGPYSTIDITAPGNITNLDPGLRDFIYNWLDAQQSKIDQLAAIIANSGVEQDAANWRDKKANRADARTTLTQQFDNAQAQIDQNATAIADQEGAFAEYQTEVTAQFNSLTATVTSTSTSLTTLSDSYASFTVSVDAAVGSLNSSVSTNASALASINGKLAAQWTVTLDVNGRVSGVKAYNDGSTSAFQILADSFLVSVPSVSGGTPISVFGAGLVNGVPAVVMKKALIADASVDTLQIAGHAVTVPTVATRSDNLTGGTSYTGSANIFASMTVNAPVGSVITIFGICSLALGYSGSLSSGTEQFYDFYITINGTAHDVQHAEASLGGVVDMNETMIGALTYTSSGNDVITAQLNATIGTNVTIGNRSIYLQAAKR